MVGWCRAFGGTTATTRHVADLGIGLLTSYRGQGIGAQLIKQAITWAAGQGFHKLTTDCFATNLPARALSQAGF